VPTKQAAADIIGLGLHEAVRSLFPRLDAVNIERFARQYSVNFRAHDKVPSKLFPYVGETLVSLKESGYLIAVATGKSRAGLDRVLGTMGMLDLFHGSRCSDESLSKPDPLMLYELLDEFDLSAGEAMMIGDTEFDLEMASRAGIRSIGVSYGAHSRDRLMQHKPVAIIDNIMHINNYIKQ
jgi:phosphoglycolate phosphatase